MARKRPAPARERGFLDWTGQDDGVNHWLGGRRLPCRICHRPTFLCDDAQVPCHKTCADAEFTRDRRKGS
ncbi:hypothetical protein ACFOWE_22995 [Planomonospora corallina]|uniref:Uncharacterized protein n=1 Tax=Planomonospora corallina TaxID=1806052 RepID=A0ABV8IAX4_9ACTN